MKDRRFSVTLFIAFMVSLLFATYSQAESLEFGWEYPVAETTKIKGFRLYRDGLVIEKDNIPPTATTVSIPRMTDMKPHSYHLVAVSLTPGYKSDPSQSAIDLPVITVQAVGPFTFKIVP